MIIVNINVINSDISYEHRRIFLTNYAVYIGLFLGNKNFV